MRNAEPFVAWYVDTSAFLKLVIAEDESAAMRAWTSGSVHMWSSHLLRTEALRAAARLGVDADSVETALESVSLILPGIANFATAGQLEPLGLRSLDALHLATALELGADLEGLVTYDSRTAKGARAAAIEVLSPT